MNAASRAAAEVAIDLAEPAQPVVVLVVDDVGLADQVAKVPLGVDPPALLEERFAWSAESRSS